LNEYSLNIWVCLSAKITIQNVTGIVYELRLPDILVFTLSALELSSVFSNDTFRNAASGRPVS
jgi:hypothetical protein